MREKEQDREKERRREGGERECKKHVWMGVREGGRKKGERVRR